MQLERNEMGYCIDASLLGELLRLPPREVQALMRSNDITSICERGEGEYEGRYRLTFFHVDRRLQLEVDEAGRVLSRPAMDFGARWLPHRKRRASGGPASHSYRFGIGWEDVK